MRVIKKIQSIIFYIQITGAMLMLLYGLFLVILGLTGIRAPFLYSFLFTF